MFLLSDENFLSHKSLLMKLVILFLFGLIRGPICCRKLCFEDCVLLNNAWQQLKSAYFMHAQGMHLYFLYLSHTPLCVPMIFGVCVQQIWSAQSNMLWPRQKGHHFSDAIVKYIFLNENVLISIRISLNLVSKGLTDNMPDLVWIMAWRRPGDKPLSQSMLVSFLTHRPISVTRPPWVKA